MSDLLVLGLKLLFLALLWLFVFFAITNIAGFIIAVAAGAVIAGLLVTFFKGRTAAKKAKEKVAA